MVIVPQLHRFPIARHSVVNRPSCSSIRFALACVWSCLRRDVQDGRTTRGRALGTLLRRFSVPFLHAPPTLPLPCSDPSPRIFAPCAPHPALLHPSAVKNRVSDLTDSIYIISFVRVNEETCRSIFLRTLEVEVERHPLDQRKRPFPTRAPPCSSATRCVLSRLALPSMPRRARLCWLGIRVSI